MVYNKIPLDIFIKDYNLPIPKEESLKRFQKHLNHFLKEYQKHTAKDTKDLESKINSLVYTLYNLTKDEIKIIEGK